MSEVLYRPMRPDDVAVAERVSDVSFLDVDRRTVRRDQPDPQPRGEGHRAGWIVRTTHFLVTDPAGCWVAQDSDGTIVGLATSIRREGTWILATYAVMPGKQGRGIGKQLLDLALDQSRGCLQGMLSASDDPRAVRRYLLAGFRVHPQMCLTGTVDRAAIPYDTGSRVREGSSTDTELMDSVDRRCRGAAHGPDHAMMQSIFRLVVSDTTAGSGYAYLNPGGTVMLLAATNRRTAEKLLWSAIADGPAEQSVRHVTAANDWAIDVGTAARLSLRTAGFLALRGLKPPTTYLHNGALL